MSINAFSYFLRKEFAQSTVLYECLKCATTISQILSLVANNKCSNFYFLNSQGSVETGNKNHHFKLSKCLRNIHTTIICYKKISCCKLIVSRSNAISIRSWSQKLQSAWVPLLWLIRDMAEPYNTPLPCMSLRANLVSRPTGQMVQALRREFHA